VGETRTIGSALRRSELREEPNVIVGTWPEDGSNRIYIRGYEGGKYEELIEAFHRDASLLLDQGYEPAGQHYIEGQWGFVMAFVATVTIPLLIGIVVWAYLLVKRPIGTLTVTYVHRGKAE
jgi:hypothetical protein